MDDVWTQVAVERRALADFLETLEPADWEVPSLCTGWKVRDVVAHVTWGPALAPTEAMLGLVKGGFRLNHVVAESARQWGQREPARMIEHLRANAEDRRHSPVITPTHVLADLICHNLDIRRPLRRPRPMPPEPFRLTADLMAGVGWPLDTVFRRSPRRTVRGLRFRAEDLEWTHGDGPEVRGTAEELLLVITGRAVGPDALAGPGAPVLYERIT